MARGSIAKEVVEQKIIDAFGTDFVGVEDKKIYVWADDGGEKVQIALSMTCPKTFIEKGERPTKTATKIEDFDWTTPTLTAPTEKVKVEITPEEKENIKNLMERFGL